TCPSADELADFVTRLWPMVPDRFAVPFPRRTGTLRNAPGTDRHVFEGQAQGYQFGTCRRQ
ncbi:hypothetical protein, partial [Streptomyces sp. NPDC057794]|uniref:hypothetical protein n=1 Tax=Streptomyces sp. NPDC057794 TaxID=3346251 RepID=UPI0036A25AC3